MLSQAGSHDDIFDSCLAGGQTPRGSLGPPGWASAWSIDFLHDTVVNDLSSTSYGRMSPVEVLVNWYR